MFLSCVPDNDKSTALTSIKEAYSPLFNSINPSSVTLLTLEKILEFFTLLFNLFLFKYLFLFLSFNLLPLIKNFSSLVFLFILENNQIKTSLLYILNFFYIISSMTFRTFKFKYIIIFKNIKILTV